jgi:hypothetical protein
MLRVVWLVTARHAPPTSSHATLRGDLHEQDATVTEGDDIDVTEQIHTDPGMRVPVFCDGREVLRRTQVTQFADGW